MGLRIVYRMWVEAGRIYTSPTHSHGFQSQKKCLPFTVIDFLYRLSFRNGLTDADKMTPEELKSIQINKFSERVTTHVKLANESVEYAVLESPPCTEAEGTLRVYKSDHRRLHDTSSAFVRNLKFGLDERIMNLRLDYENRVRVLIKLHHHRMDDLRTDFDLAQRVAVAGVEATFRHMISEANRVNHSAINEIKSRNSEKVELNLERMKKLKFQLGELRRESGVSARALRVLMKKHEKLSGPVSDIQADIARMADEVSAFNTRVKPELEKVMHSVMVLKREIKERGFMLECRVQQLEILSAAKPVSTRRLNVDILQGELTRMKIDTMSVAETEAEYVPL